MENKTRKKDIFDEDFEILYEGDLSGFGTDDDLSPGEPAPEQSRQKADRSGRRKRSVSLSALSSPVAKTVKTGAKAVSRLIQLFCKSGTLILIALITGLLGYHFFRGAGAYGDPLRAISERNFVLAAYAGFAAALLLFEVFSFFWAMTGPRAARQDRGSFKVDTGRGLLSFVLTGCGSCLASVFGPLIPTSPLPLTGLQGAVTIYGSLMDFLVPLCILGVVCCILRKIFH